MANKRREFIGRVISDQRNKTITVAVETYVNHPIYKKRIKSTKKFHAHDEKNIAKLGDIVKISETRPLSAQKKFRFVKLLEKAVTQ